MKRKGVSPVIATVLLIAIVIALALIIFLWFRGFIQEAVTKNGENVALVCNDVNLEISYSSGTIYFENNGNVPIYDFSLKILRQGSYETKSLRSLGVGWSSNGLSAGASDSIEIGDVINDANNLIAIPVLLGET